MVYFTEKFDDYALPGESITATHGRFTLTATIEADEFHGAPWEEYDGHGPVTLWETRAKRPGELILNGDRHGYCRFYDFAEACRIARRDGWGTADGRQPGESARAYAARAARADFDVLRAWCNDDWHYVTLTVTAAIDDVELASFSIGGIECNYPGSDNSYLTECADDAADMAIDDAKAKLAKLTATAA